MKLLKILGTIGCLVLVGITFLLSMINAITLKLITGRALCEYEPFGLDLFMIPYYWLEELGYWNPQK
jgi:hypothetical protein